MWLTTHKTWSSVTHSLVEEILQNSVLEQSSVLVLRVLVSWICLQWALRSCQCEAAQLTQSQGSIHEEVMLFQKKGKLCTSLFAMRLWKGWGYLWHSCSSRYPLRSLLWVPVSLPSFYRDVWYCCCPWQCILLILFMIFVKLPHRILVYSVRIYERALKQKTCCWISMLSHTLITSHLEG